jgi:ABC-type dipeptide/oligopeptide/nickel transport system permease component
MTRATLIDELRELYVLAARARGVSSARAVISHALRNSLIPVVTIIGLQLGAVLTGTIITETIFAWPGVGRLLIQAISFRDYPLVQGASCFIATTYVTMNLLVDLVYGWIRSEDSLPVTRTAGPASFADARGRSDWSRARAARCDRSGPADAA